MKTAIILILAAFTWSIQACTNRTNNANNDHLSDSLDHDTMVTPAPIDTSNHKLDTMNMNQDTVGMERPNNKIR